MSELIDISIPLRSSVPVWPGSSGFKQRRVLSMLRGDDCNASVIEMDVHVGTHIDAPLHFIEGGGDAAGLALATLIGPALVIDVADAAAVTRSTLERANVPLGTERLLLRTSNTSLRRLKDPQFDPRYVALTPDAAEWVRDFGIRLIGIDYLSIQRFETDTAVHRILLEAGVVIVEGLCLEFAPPGHYELLCLPLCLMGCEAAPARVLLKRDPGASSR